MDPNPRRLTRRLPIAILVALTVTGAFGAAIASTSQPASADHITIPSPRIGDRGSYNLSLIGDWDREDVRGVGEPQAPYGTPWRGLEFAWTMETGMDGSGATGPADRLDARSWGWDLDMFSDANWSLAPHEQHTWYRSGERSAYAFYDGTMSNASGTTTSVATVPVLTSDFGFSVAAASTFYTTAQPDCIFDGEMRGEIDLDAPFSWTDLSCQTELLYGSWYGPDRPMSTELTVYEFEYAGEEQLATGAASRFDPVGDNPFSVWLSQSFPVPVKFMVRDAADPSRFALYQLSEFEAGEKLRESRGAWTQPLPAFAQTARPAWGMDEAVIEHRFPLSQAYKLGSEIGTIRDFLASRPAYLGRADVRETQLYGQLNRTWELVFTDGQTAITVEAWDEIPEQFDGQLPAIRALVANRGAHVVHVDLAGENTPHPSRAALPAEAPSVSQIWARWQVFSEGIPNAWGFELTCGVTCEIADAQYWGGIARADVVIADPSSPGPDDLVVRNTWVATADSAIMNANGTLLNHQRMAMDFGGKYGIAAAPVAPSSSPAASAPIRGWLPSPAVAAGVGFFGVLAGLAYYLWPTLKAGPLALFSRVNPRTDQHPARLMLCDLVASEPGIHFAEVQRRSGLANGTLVHHLQALVSQKRLQSMQSGGYTCYFPAGGRMDAGAGALKADGARRLLAAIQASPGISGLELAGRTGLTASTVHHHVQRLIEGGLVTGTRDGRSLRLHALVPAAAQTAVAAG